MKINGLSIGLLIALVILLVYNFRSCNLNDAEVARLEAIVESRDAQLAEKDKAYEDAKGEHEEKIAELDGAIDSYVTVIAKLEEEQVVKDDRIAELIKEDEQLEDYEPKYYNMKEQRDKWIAKFNLSEDKLSEKDKIIFSINEKYEAEKKLRIEGAEALIKEHKQNIKDRDELIAELKHRLKIKRRASTLERTVGLAVVAFLAYSALSK